ncbi:MAG: transpeptidase family protein [Ignavibacteriales bacterium]|nr:MAG: transpeptidase family protein [Ignavibacteriales bacterium]
MNNSRALVVIALIFLFFVALVVKLVDIQLVKGEELRYFAEKQQTRVEKINPERGFIFDRDNTLLVYNKNDVSFFVDLRMTKKADKQKIAERFSKIFKKNKSHYLDLMSGTGKNICIEKKVASETALQLKQFKVNGLFYAEDPTRVYHYENFASHVLGYVNNENVSVNGIEKFFDKNLTGTEGIRLVERNAIDQMITISEEETRRPVNGNNIVLTISKSYQNILEEELKRGIELYEGSDAVGVMMDPNTGEIIALSSIGDFDPNKYWDYSDSERRNKVITDTYEPGSTFKAISMSALIDQNLVNDKTLVFGENGKYRYKNVNITDTHENGWLNPSGVMEQSSNIGMAKLAQKLDEEIFYKYIRGFGFGNYTSINLPGEVKGRLKKPTEWNDITKAFVSFGYEISVTPIQMAAAYCAIVNGGILYQPQLIKKEIGADGNIIYENQPKEVRRIISAGTSEKMKKILASVVEKGTGKNAKSELIHVGGKTGTSQKLVNGKYSKTEYNSSFVGFFPADNPKVVCLVLVNSPKVGKYGGYVAAPIFKNIVDRIITSNLKDFQAPEVNKENDADIKMVFTKNSEQTFSPKKYKKVTITNKNIMPDLNGATLRDAITALTELGINYKVTGSGIISTQSIIPGEKIKKGMICFLQCAEVSIEGAAVY